MSGVSSVVIILTFNSVMFSVNSFEFIVALSVHFCPNEASAVLTNTCCDSVITKNCNMTGVDSENMSTFAV